MSFSKLLGRLRKQKRFTHRALAEQVGWTHTFIGYLENGSRLPSVVQAIELARALETDPHELALEALTERVMEAIQKSLDLTLSESDRIELRRMLQSRYGGLLETLIAKTPKPKS